MTGNLYVKFSYITLVVMFIALIACSTGTRIPWVENGTRVGTIWKNKTIYGSESRFINTARQLKRVERRDRENILLPGASVTKYIYNSNGELFEEINFNASDIPTSGRKGYVVKKYIYSVDDAGNRVVSHAFLNEEREPVRTINGYAVAKLVYDRSTSRLKEVFLEDERKEPASGSWDGINGVARVKYTVLEGVGDIRYGIYYSPSGTMVERKKLNGTCFYHTKNTTTTYHRY